MSRVVFQPAGGADARRHYRDTILHPVPLEPNRALLGSDYDALLEQFPHGHAAIWGVTPGGNDRNVRLYQRLSISDLVLFAGGGRFFAAGTVAYKWHNPAFAAQLWGVDEDGRTWEHMYALDE